MRKHQNRWFLRLIIIVIIIISLFVPILLVFKPMYHISKNNFNQAK